MENILNNDENKELFLKAIILGINYGKSRNASYYLENIEKELFKLKERNLKFNEKILKYDINNNNEKYFLLNYENNILNYNVTLDPDIKNLALKKVKEKEEKLQNG